MPLLLALRFWEVTATPVAVFIVRRISRVISATPVRVAMLVVRHAITCVACGVTSVTAVIERRPHVGVFISRTPVSGLTLFVRERVAAIVGDAVRGLTISLLTTRGFPVKVSTSKIIGGTVSMAVTIAP